MFEKIISREREYKKQYQIQKKVGEQKRRKRNNKKGKKEKKEIKNKTFS